MRLKIPHMQIADNGPGWLSAIIEAAKERTGAIHVASGRMTHWEEYDYTLNFEVWFDSSEWTGRRNV